MEKECRKYLLAIARAYARATGYSLATVARRFHGAHDFFENFAAGSATITLRKFDEMLEQFCMAWPANARWPDRVINFEKKLLKNRAGKLTNQK